MTNRFEGLTKAQEELFERIAVNDDRFVNDRTVQKLIDKGLVERYEDHPAPMVTIYRYRVPLNVHLRWCEWCAGKGR